MQFELRYGYDIRIAAELITSIVWILSAARKVDSGPLAVNSGQINCADQFDRS